MCGGATRPIPGAEAPVPCVIGMSGLKPRPISGATAAAISQQQRQRRFLSSKGNGRFSGAKATTVSQQQRQRQFLRSEGNCEARLAESRGSCGWSSDFMGRSCVEEAIQRSDQPEGLQQPDDDTDDDDDADDLLDRAIHRDQVDQVQHQADDNECNDDADDSRREHAHSPASVGCWKVELLRELLRLAGDTEILTLGIRMTNEGQISRMTGMISGRRLVLFWM